MSDVIPVALRIRDSAREPTHASLEVESIPMPARVGRAVGLFVVLVGLAVGSVFVPLLHFVLVPGFAIAAFVLPVLTVRASVRVLSSEVKCPKCGEVTPIEKGRRGWPVALWCKQCGTSFRATPG